MGAISDADSDTASLQRPFKKKQYQPIITSKTAKIIVAFLCGINFLNYVDRYTLISVLGKVKEELAVSATQQGLVATIFIVAYMLASPIAGYYGDKYSRKLLITIGVLVWSGSLILAYMIPECQSEKELFEKEQSSQTAEQKKTFYMLLGTRIIFGVGEAAYMAVAPGIIHDIYCDESSRTLALTIFNGMIPLGGGFGYMLPTLLPASLRTWRGSMVCTVPITLTVLVLFYFKFKDIPHGYSDLLNQAGNQNKLKKFKSPPWTDTLKGFLKNSTYKFTVLGFTCVCYIMGAGSTFLPQLYKYSDQMLHPNEKPENLEANYESMKLMFGGITMVSGIVGCVLGSVFSDKWRKMNNPRSDSDVCAIGMLFGSLCLYISLLTSGSTITISLVLYFFGATGVNFNWALTVKMVMDVVRPNEKSSANAILTLIAHALGDAFSPVLVGYCTDMLGNYLVSNDEQFKGLTKDDAKVQYHSLQQPLMSMALMAALGAVFFFLASIYIVEDSKSKLHQELEQSESDGDEVPNAHQTTPFSDSGHETDNVTRVIYRKPSVETMRMSVGNS